MYHNRPTVADLRAMKARGQKISMLYVTNFEEAAAAASRRGHQYAIHRGPLHVS
jgi:3-methyl-2-oxobutanoate hydroxymethyltransferase